VATSPLIRVSKLLKEELADDRSGRMDRSGWERLGCRTWTVFDPDDSTAGACPVATPDATPRPSVRRT
jgi:hypothetical protein